MSFRALLLTQDDEGLASPAVTEIEPADLPPGEVTVAVEYSTLNYKDGLCLSPKGGGLVREAGIEVHSLARIASMKDGKVEYV